MDQEGDEYTKLLQGRLRDRLGDRRYGEVLDTVLGNLEAYAVTRDGSRARSPVARALAMPGPELDAGTRALLAELLDHVLRQVTGATG